jgi:hypothetical protein
MKAEAWSEGLGRMIGPLVDRGVEVVIVHTVPKFWGWDSRDCAALRLLLDAETCAISVDRAETDLLRERAIWAESTAASTSGARTLDVSDLLCAEDVCLTHRDGIWLWRDGSHITVDAANTLVPAFAHAF